MSWLNFNDSLNSIKGQLSSFANTVLAEEKSGDENDAETVGESEIVRENKNEHDVFEKEDTWRWSTDESKTDQLKTDETITNLKKKILELENENRDLISSLDRLEQNHEENNGELIKIKNKLKDELETVTEKYEVLNMRYNKLALAENGYKKRLNELKNKCENIPQDDGEKKILEEKIASLEGSNQELRGRLNDMNGVIDLKLPEMEANVNRLECENKALKISLQMYKNKEKTSLEYDVKIKNLEDELVKLKTENEKNQSMNIHRNYLTMLNDRFFEYFKIPLNDQDTHSLETTFHDALANISNLLKSYETKFALMESRIFELTQNRTDIQNEKNEEIERLLQNSEMLTQELLRKSQEIKDLEDECSQLMEKNDLVIQKLADAKENSLQTIFESNEENVDTLEKEVECANQKIDELKHQLSECQSGTDENVNEEIGVLKKIIEGLELELKTTRSERDNCRVLIDKMRLDFETTEYQFSEMNVNLETLSEEIEKHKRKIDALNVENNDLKTSKIEETAVPSGLIEHSQGLHGRIEEFEAKIYKELQNKEGRIAKCFNEISALRKELEDVAKSRDELQESLNNRQRELDELLRSAGNVHEKLQEVTILKNKLQENMDKVGRELQDVMGQRDEALLFLENTRKELQTVTGSRNELQSSLEDAQGKLQALTTSGNISISENVGEKLQASQKQLQAVTSSKSELQASLEVAQKKLDERNVLQASLVKSQEELQVITASKNELQTSLEDVQKKLQEVVVSRNELQASHAELQAVATSRNEIQTSLEDAQKKLQEVVVSRNELQSSLEDAQGKLQALTMTGNNSISENVQEKLQASQKELHAVILSNSELQTSLKVVQKKLGGMIASRNELQASLVKSQEELQDITASRNELQLSLEDAQKKLQELVVSRNELQVYLENSQDELQAVKTSRSELQARLENSQSELQAVAISKDEIQAALQEQLQELTAYNQELQVSLENSQRELQAVISSRNELQASQDKTTTGNDLIEKKLQQLTTSNNELQASLEHTQKELQDTLLSRNELIAIVQTKHQETLTYHAEIQRLSEILRGVTEKNIQLENQMETLKKTARNDEEMEKLNDQLVFLREKCNVMAQNILDEQRKGENEKLAYVEKETTLNKNLERLQNHLMEIEEHYTQELLQSEGKIALLQARLNEVEQREKDSSTIYTSVSIRANQQNEALQQQLQSMMNQRDELKKKFMELEDENNVKTAALTNLQLVLEQFQKDKEGDVVRETERIRRQLKHEQKIQEDLRHEITSLESQIKENKQGLQAALRLADQLEASKSQISNLREEINVLTEKLGKKEEELKTIASQTDGKIDKSLIKNLIIGFVTSNNKLNKDQSQILKIIATVLDFNEQEHNRVNLNQTQQSNWLKSILMPISGDDAPTYESLSRAFVNFLENESKPRVVPSLLPQQSEESNVSTSSSSSRTTPTPIVLNEIVLPTFSDFPQHRNSSSILKGVLKDNP